MAKKNSLGRGLGALIDSNDDREQTYATKMGGVAEVAIAHIDANPYQPRTIFDEETLEELASSIKEIGIIIKSTLQFIFSLII